MPECDHNCIPCSRMWRSGWVCVRCGKWFKLHPANPAPRAKTMARPCPNPICDHGQVPIWDRDGRVRWMVECDACGGQGVIPLPRPEKADRG